MRDFMVFVSKKGINDLDPFIQNMIKRFDYPYCFDMVLLPDSRGVLVSCFGITQRVLHDNIVRIEAV